MHAHGRAIDGRREPFGHRCADQQRAGQPRPGGVGHHIQRIWLQRRPVEHLANHRRELAHVIARGQFRHHPAVAGMIELGIDRLGDDALAVPVHSHSRFVAGSLDAQNGVPGGLLRGEFWLHQVAYRDILANSPKM